MALELLKIAAKLRPASTAAGLEDHILRFSLEYPAVPALATERQRLETLFGGDGFSLRHLPSQEDPDILLLEFPFIERQQSAAFLLQTAQELVDALGLRSCTPDVDPGWIEDDELGRDAPESVGGAMRLLCESQAVPNNDPMWAVQMILAPAAWATFNCTGEGILVGQPDTGVSDHRELDDSLDIARGIDIVTGNGPPVDPLSGRFLTNPGHGTATASCVASRQAGLIAGAAPGAKVVPIRCVEHVVLRSGAAVAAAIDHARKSGCHVVTMSLGGPIEFPELRRAIKRAVDSGMIVLAAAGNCVRIVVYPAWDSNVIAIAGVDQHGRRWKGSSHGQKIDVAAPGEHVYVARRTTPSDAVKSVVLPGQGTSFAVALTAGCAALWLSRHGMATVKAKAAAQGASVQEMFRAALRQSAQKLPEWPGSMGAGLVNAKDLLALNLDTIAIQALPASAHPAHSVLGENFNWPRFAAEAGFVALDRVQRGDPLRTAALESVVAPRPSAALRAAIREANKKPLELFAAPSVVSPLTPEITPVKALRIITAGVPIPSRLVEGVQPISDKAARSFLEGSGGNDVRAHVERVLTNGPSSEGPAGETRRQLHVSIEGLIGDLAKGAAVRSLGPQSRIALEALIRMTGRPALRTADGIVDKDDPELGEWASDLLPWRNKLKPLIDSVGRIDIEIDSELIHVGTGTVVAPGIVMTNRHVLDAIAEPVPMTGGKTRFLLTGPITIAFDDTAQDLKHRFKVIGVVTAGRNRIGQHADIRKLDMAFLEVETVNAARSKVPPPVPMRDLPANGMLRMIVVGYPAKPNSAAATDPNTGQISLEMWDRLGAIYQNSYGQKYVSPGEIVLAPGKLPDDSHAWAFSHDATTLNGNSGSVIIDLATHRVCGLHFGGAPLRQNLAHGIKAVERAAAGVIDPAVFTQMNWL